MAFTGEKLMQGIDSYVSKAISRLSYNTTELCTISKVNNDNSYQVTNGTVSFKAWGGNEKYAQNDSVYVLVPNGTHDAECMILRKKTTDQDIKVQRESPKDNIAIIGDNLIDLGESDSSGKITIEKRGLREDDFTRHRLDRLYIKFKSYAETGRNAASPSSVLSQGSYTIQFKIEIEGGQTIVFDIPSEDLEGNLFASEEAATYQEECWGINYNRIFQAMLFENPDLYQDVATGEIKVRSNSVPDGEVPAINLIPTGFSYDVIYGSGVDVYGNAVSNINSGSTAITINVELEEIYFGIDPNSFEGTQIDIWWTKENGEIDSKESYGANNWTETDGNLAKWYAQACIYYKDPETGAVTRIGNEQEVLDFQKEIQLKWYINDSTMYKVTDDPTSEAGWLLLENERELSEDIANAIENDENITDKEKSLEASKKLQNTLKFAFTPRKNLVYYLRTLQLRAAVYIDKVAQDGYSNVLNVNNDDYGLRDIIEASEGFNIQADDNYNGKFFVYSTDGNLINFNNETRSLSIFYNYQNLLEWGIENLKIEDTLEIIWSIAGNFNYVILDKKTNNQIKIKKNSESTFIKFTNDQSSDLSSIVTNDDIKFYYNLINMLFEQSVQVTVSCQLKQNDQLINTLSYTIFLGQGSEYKSGVNFQIIPKSNRRPVVLEDSDNILQVQAVLLKDDVDISSKLDNNINWSWEYPKNERFLEFKSTNIILDGAVFENNQSELILINAGVDDEKLSGQIKKGYTKEFQIFPSQINKSYQIEFSKELKNIVDDAEITDITISIEKKENDIWYPLPDTAGSFNSTSNIFIPGVDGFYRIKFDFDGDTGFIKGNVLITNGDYDADNTSIIIFDSASNANQIFVQIDNEDEHCTNLGDLYNISLKAQSDDTETDLGYIYMFGNKTESLVNTCFVKNIREGTVEHFEGTAKENNGDIIPGLGRFNSSIWSWCDQVDYNIYINVLNVGDSDFLFTFNLRENMIGNIPSNSGFSFFYLENQILFYFFSTDSCYGISKNNMTNNFSAYTNLGSPAISNSTFTWYHSGSRYIEESFTIAFSIDWDYFTTTMMVAESPTLESLKIYYYEDINRQIDLTQIPTVNLSNLKISDLSSSVDTTIKNIFPILGKDKTGNNYHILKAMTVYQGETLTSYLPIGYCNMSSLNNFNNYLLSESTNYYYSIDNNLLKENQQGRDFHLINLNDSEQLYEILLLPDDIEDMPISADGGTVIQNFKLESDDEKTYNKIYPPIWFDENNEVSIKIIFNDYFWTQPLFQVRNSNFSSLLSEWNGGTEVQEGSIKTALGIFGTKNIYNKFTGIVLGDTTKLKSGKEKPYGIYGLKSIEDKTEETFHITVNGDAYLKGEIIAEKGQIGGLTLSNGKLYNNIVNQNTFKQGGYGINTSFNDISNITLNERKNLITNWGNEYFLVAGTKTELKFDNSTWKTLSYERPPEEQPNFFVTEQGSLYAQQANLFPSTLKLYNEKQKDLTYTLPAEEVRQWTSLGEWIQIEKEMAELTQWLNTKYKNGTLLYFLREFIKTSNRSGAVQCNTILNRSDDRIVHYIKTLSTILMKEFIWDNNYIKYQNMNYDQIIMSTNNNDSFSQAAGDEGSPWTNSLPASKNSLKSVWTFPTDTNLVQTVQTPTDRYFNKLAMLLNFVYFSTSSNQLEQNDQFLTNDNFEYDFGYADMIYDDWITVFDPNS